VAPHLTLVVSSYRRPEALATLFASLAVQTLSHDEFAVDVVVDGLDDTEARYRAVLERVRASAPYTLSYEFQANSGQSVARHRAISRVATPWVCVVDDDMDLAPGFLAAHLAALRSGTARTVVLGRVIPEDGWTRTPLYEAVRTSHMLESHDGMARGLRQPGGWALVTQNVSFAREFYLSVGGFDEKLRLGEDSELGLRFEFAGGRFVFAEAAAAIHRSRVGSYDAWLRRCVEYGKNGVYIFEKLGSDARAHPLRNLVHGSRLNAAAVHALCWSDALAFGGIECLRRLGNGLQRVGLPGPGVATHKAILAIAFHLGVKRSLGSWREVLAEARRLSRMDGTAYPT
jgi:GT2 family glycosyltransferase